MTYSFDSILENIITSKQKVIKAQNIVEQLQDIEPCSLQLNTE